MIDKIDRPEAPPAYYITRPKDAKESQHEQQERKDEEGERRRKEASEKEWSKFDRRTTVIRPHSARREQIRRCLFRGVFLHSGVGTLQLDVIWRDGHKTAGALVLLARLEDYLRLKKFSPGQEVPDTFWSHGGKVEMGLIQVISSGVPSRQGARTEAEGRGARKTSPASPSALEAAGILKHSGRGIRWGVLAVYALLAGIALMIVLAIVR